MTLPLALAAEELNPLHKQNWSKMFGFILSETCRTTKELRSSPMDIVLLVEM